MIIIFKKFQSEGFDIADSCCRYPVDTFQCQNTMYSVWRVILFLKIWTKKEIDQNILGRRIFSDSVNQEESFNMKWAVSWMDHPLPCEMNVCAHRSVSDRTFREKGFRVLMTRVVVQEKWNLYTITLTKNWKEHCSYEGRATRGKWLVQSPPANVGPTSVLTTCHQGR